MKISVIAIFYNSHKYVKKCVDSILSQEGVDIELIAIDDCSKDDTYSLLSSYDDERIKIVRHAENRGISGARNSGLKNVTGDCFFFIDGDDYLPPLALFNLAKYYSKDVDWVQGGFVVREDDSGRVLREKKSRFGQYNTYKEIVENFSNLEFVYIHNRLINVKYKNIYLEDKVHEDRFWNVEVFNSLKSIVNVDAITYCYTSHLDSFSNKGKGSKRYIDCSFELLERMVKLDRCWKWMIDTFHISCIEKGIYLYGDFSKKERLEYISKLKRLNIVELDVSGFPRYLRYLHRMVDKGVPDCVIVGVTFLYKSMKRALNQIY
jgi:glycosyltransferase involved in cell wall biosynthesis